MPQSPDFKLSQYQLTSVEIAVMDAVKQHDSPMMPINCQCLQQLTGYSREQIQAATCSLKDKKLLRESFVPRRLI